MCTARALTASPSIRGGGTCVAVGGVHGRGQVWWGHAWQGGGMHGEGHTWHGGGIHGREGGICGREGAYMVGGACMACMPPPLWTEFLTFVKTLPSRNFIAGGNIHYSIQDDLSVKGQPPGRGGPK